MLSLLYIFLLVIATSGASPLCGYSGDAVITTSSSLYLLDTGELLRWHRWGGQALLERSTPLDERLSFELFYKNCLFPPIMSVCSEAAADTIPWPPNELSIYFLGEEPNLFLCATLEVNSSERSARLQALSCHATIAKKDYTKQRAHRWIPESFCSDKGALVVLNNASPPLYLQLHCLNREIIGDAIAVWKGSKELSLYWQLSAPSSFPSAAVKINEDSQGEVDKAKFALSTALFTRVVPASGMDVMNLLASEFVENQEFYQSSNRAGRYQQPWDLHVLNADKSAIVKPYTRGKSVPLEVWQDMQPYLLPQNHPLRAQLDELFKTRITLNSETLKAAGFLTPFPRPFSHAIVSKNEKIQKFVFKFFSDDQPKINDSKLLLRRILGAAAVKKSIKRLGWAKHFVVPKKWIYPLPEFPAPPPGSFRKNFILIAEEINIFHSEANRIQWRSKMTPLLLRGIYSIVTDVGLYDSLIPSNIPFSKHHLNRMVFIDTEHFNSWPLFYGRIEPYLKVEMQQVWKTLVNTGKISAFKDIDETP